MSPEESAQQAVDRLVRDVPDFPRRGVVFKDIMPLLADHNAFRTVVEALAEVGRDEGRAVVDKVAGMEARGFMFAAPVALALGCGFVPLRKPGKLPGHTHAVRYKLEYGEATLEAKTDAIDAGERVLIVDDVLATGGTADAARRLVEELGGEAVGLAVLLELGFLDGRLTTGALPVTALRTVEG